MKEKALNKIFIDFDQTLSKTTFNPTTGKYDMGSVYEPVAEAVTKQHLLGRDIVIFTARPKREWPEIRKWLDREAIPYKKVTNRKKPALLYVDDKAIRPDEFYIYSQTQALKGLPEEPPNNGEYGSDGERA